MRTFCWRGAVLALLVAGCGGGQPARDTSEDVESRYGNSEAPARPTRARPDARQPGDSLMEAMEAHAESLHGATEERLQAVLPEHRARTDTLIAVLEREMKAAGVPPDSVWTATADTVRHELETMPGMSPYQLRNVFPLHVFRIKRLLREHRAQMHESDPDASLYY